MPGTDREKFEALGAQETLRNLQSYEGKAALECDLQGLISLSESDKPTL